MFAEHFLVAAYVFAVRRVEDAILAVDIYYSGFCLATDRRNVAVGLKFEASRESQLWTIVFREVDGEVAEKTASDNAVGHFLRRHIDYHIIMCFARGVPAAEPGEPHGGLGFPSAA